MEENNSELIESMIRVGASLFEGANQDKSTWVDICRKVMPELLPAAELQDTIKPRQERKCSHARVDILALATAHMSHIFPEGQRWFRFEPWVNEEGYSVTDEDSWFAQATEIARRELARSNFQTEMNSVCVDRCIPGTGLLLAEMDAKNDVLVFTHIPAGTFGLAQDAQRNVNSVVRKFNYTAAQMMEAFGLEELPEDIKRAYEKDSMRYKNQYEVWHLVAPSRDFFPNLDTRLLEINPYISAYILPQYKSLLQMETCFEFPYMATRYMRYGNSVYGISPLMNIADTIDDLIVQEDVQKTIAQRSAVPSVILPADMEGEVDLRAGGQTIIPLQYINSQVPREWAAPTNYQVGLDQLERLKAEIDAATHVDAMQVISKTDRYMSATEVSARESERVTAFYPSFAQCQVDARPLWNRVFALLYRAGKFDELDDMPSWVIEEVPYGDDMVGERIISPKVAYTGRMAQMMERIQTNSTDAFIAKILQIASATQDPTPLACIDWLVYTLNEAYASGVSIKCIRKPSDVKKELNRLQELRNQQQLMQNEAMAAAANRDNAAADNYRAQYEQ